MPRPTYLQWRTGTMPGYNGPAPDIKMRQLMALASFVSRVAPDGTVF